MILIGSIMGGLTFFLFAVMQQGALKSEQSQFDDYQKQHYREKIREKYVNAIRFLLLGAGATILLILVTTL